MITLMPKILYFTFWYPSVENPLAGIFVREHAKAVHKRGIDLTVLHFHVKKGKGLFSSSIRMDRLEGIHTIVLTFESILWKLFYQVPFLLWPFLESKMKSEEFRFFSEFELVHSHVIFPAGILGRKLAGRLKIPHIISEHWSGTGLFLRRHIFSCMAKRAYKLASAVLPVSDPLQQVILHYCSSLKKTAIIPNVIDTEIFRYIEKSKQDKLIFCAVSVYQKKRTFLKRPDLFVEALGKLKNKIPADFELIVAGGGNLAGKIQERCRQLGIKAEFIDFLEKNEIAKIMQKSSIFLHATEYETFGIVVYEALSTGTPVIVSNLDVFKGLINEENGVLCGNSVDEWVNGISLALSRSYNNQKIADMVKNKYSYNAVGVLLLDIYRKVLTIQ